MLSALPRAYYVPVDSLGYLTYVIRRSSKTRIPKCVGQLPNSASPLHGLRTRAFVVFKSLQDAGREVYRAYKNFFKFRV